MEEGCEGVRLGNGGGGRVKERKIGKAHSFF